MAQLPILEYPNARLRTRAQPVRQFDAALARLIDDMFETMYAARGIGLAATQVDVHLQVVTIDISGKGEAPEVFINPEILSSRRLGKVEESCLSVPGVADLVRRHTVLRVRALDRNGQSVVREVEGMLAVCLGHEVDHLRGRLFVDRLSLFKRLLVRLHFARAGLRKPAPAHAAASPAVPRVASRA
jgi:peptide deformylase